MSDSEHSGGAGTSFAVGAVDSGMEPHLVVSDRGARLFVVN